MDFICRQTYIFLLACLAGLIAGFIFDIFRVKRKLVRTPDFIVQIEDILYWLIISVVLFVLMYYSNESEIRSYILLGILIGVIIYVLILSKYVFLFFVNTIRVLYKIIIFPINIFVKIFRIPIKIIVKNLLKIKGKFHKISQILKSKLIFYNKILKRYNKKSK